MAHKPWLFRKSRRGVIAVLSAVLFVVMLGMIAFAVDIGFLSLAKTQLQSAADSAALAAAAVTNEPRATVEQTAQEFSGYHNVAGRPIQLNTEDIEFGRWDADARTFTPMTSASNAVRVTVRTHPNSGGATPLFFARIFGRSSQEQSATAIATANPRDIAFVVDLSGSMNDDTDPSYSTSSPSLIQDVYDDFNFGAYPGASQYAGQPLGIYNTSKWVDKLTKKNGPLTKKSIPYRYRVNNKDSKSLKKWKAYAWVMEVQMLDAGLMPDLIPVPNADSSANYNYWKAFIDGNRSDLGYESYVDVMMDKARDGKLGGSYTPLSLKSELCPCPMHMETVTGESFSFPPSEMPTHAARRAMIAALQVIEDRNQTIADVNQKDWVSVIAFDTISAETIKWSLGNKDNYSGAMQICTELQANGWTGTEAGMDLAYDHIKPENEGGMGRNNANKIVVLLTDGMPNQKRSSITKDMINDYADDNPSVWTDPDTGQEVDNWVSDGSYKNEKNAALMQTSMMQGDNWYAYAAGIGRGCDYDFMDRVARMGATANNQGQSPRGSDDPTKYEAVLRQIFEDIITNPKLRLVQ